MGLVLRCGDGGLTLNDMAGTLKSSNDMSSLLFACNAKSAEDLVSIQYENG